MVADQLLHALARLLLRLCSPKRACAILAHIGALLPTYGDRLEVLRAARRLGRRGSCLSRAVALAARVPEAEIVIGVDPHAGDRLLAHAWLELCGEPIDPSDVTGVEMGQLCRRRLRNMAVARL